MTHDRNYLKGVMFALGTCLCFGTLGIIDKIGSENNPLIFSFQSLLFSLLFSLIFALIYFKDSFFPAIRKLSFSSWQLIITVGLLASGFAILLRFFGLRESTGTFASLSQVITTSTTVILAWIVFKEKLSKLAWIFFVMIVISIYFVSVGKIALVDIKNGDKFILLGALLIGTSNIFSKKAILVVNPILLSVGRFFFGFLFLLIVGLLLDGSGMIFKQLSWWVILSGLLWTGNVLFFNLAIKRVGVTLTTSLIMMAPVLTMALEYSLLEYQFTLVQIVAAMVVIISGIAIIFANNNSYLK